MTFDVLVMGAGPAGSAAAIRAAQGGLKVALVERYAFPRDLPGEAMHPSAEGVFRKLGVAKRVAEAEFIRSPGWILQSSKRHVILFVDRGRLRFGYQAWRAELDTLLLDQARALGVHVLQPVRVNSVALREKLAQTDQGEIRFEHWNQERLASRIEAARAPAFAGSDCEIWVCVRRIGDGHPARLP